MQSEPLQAVELTRLTTDLTREVSVNEKARNAGSLAAIYHREAVMIYTLELLLKWVTLVSKLLPTVSLPDQLLHKTFSPHDAGGDP